MLREKVLMVQDELDDGVDGNSKGGKHGLYFDATMAQRLSAGVVVVTSAQNNMDGTDFNSISNNPIVSSPSSVSVFPPLAPAAMSSFRGGGSGLSTGVDGGGSQYSLQQKPKANRRSQSHASNGLNGNGLGESKDFKSQLDDPGTTWFGSHVNGNSVASSDAVAPLSTASVSIEQLYKGVRKSRRSGEDVISMISVKSTMDDPHYKWVPFSILPDEAVIRLLTCTSLVITSPSFNVHNRYAYLF